MACSVALRQMARHRIALNSGTELFLIIFFCCTGTSPGIAGCSQENRVGTVLSSLHFHFLDLRQQRTERSVVKENTHLHDKNLALSKISETGKRLHMRTSIGHSLSKLIGACDDIVKTLLTG